MWDKVRNRREGKAAMTNQIPNKYADISFDLYPEYKTGKEQTLDMTDSLWWGEGWDHKSKDARYMIPKFLSGSDYSGTLVEKSNAQAFAEQSKGWTTQKRVQRSVSAGHHERSVRMAVHDESCS
jgi:hypothetical protein